METKFPANVTVLEIVSNEGNVMPSHFFPRGLRFNAENYVLEWVV